MTSGDFRIVEASPAESDGETLLVESSACHFGSGGPSGAACFGAGAFALTSPGPAAAAAASAAAHGAGPSTSMVSNLITSTGQPSAATMIDGVSGLVNSALIAGGRIRHVVSCT